MRTSGFGQAAVLAIIAAWASPLEASARQVVESICTGEQWRGFGSSSPPGPSGTLPSGPLSVGERVTSYEQCGPVFVRVGIEWTPASFLYGSESFGEFWSEFNFLLQAGPEGMALRVESGAAVYAWVGSGRPEHLAAGSLFVAGPHEQVSFHAELWQGAPRSLLLAESGEIADAVGLGGSWYADVVDETWLCSTTQPWSIHSDEIDCGIDGDPDCNPSGGWFGIGSDSGSIGASLSAGSWPSVVRVRSEFLLEYGCCVWYEQEGGFYCDGYPTIDGAELPRPPGYAGCERHAGAITLSAGWHVVEESEWDSGSGGFSLVFSAGDCGPDCDLNGRPDSVDIEWGIVYEGVELDTDHDGRLDACERGDGDLDLDGTIGPADLASILALWGRAGDGDLDGDGSVGAGDLRILLSRWGPLG